MKNLAQTESSLLTGDTMIVGVVVDNNDLTKKQRIRVSIPGILEAADVNDLPWILPKADSMFGVGDDYGTVSIPRIGSRVYVVFQKGDLSLGRYVADALTSHTALPPDLATNYPNRVGFFSPKGDVFYMDMSTGDTVFKHASGSSIRFAADGSVLLYTKSHLTQVVDGNMTTKVRGNLSVSIEGSSSTQVSGSASTMVQGSMTTSVSGDQSELVSGKRTISCSSEAHIGDITNIGDVSASGVSLINHIHFSGSSTTGVPV